MEFCRACGKIMENVFFHRGLKLCSEKCCKLIDATGKRNPVHAARIVFRQCNISYQYLLRDIPNELWAKIISRDESARDIILTALTNYLSQ